MNIIEAINKRKSIRDFQAKPVPKDVLKAILELAARSPSAMNTWHLGIYSCRREVLDKIRQASIEKLNSGEYPKSEHSLTEWTKDSVYRKRQVELAKELFRLMGIAREDEEKRKAWRERGFRYFNAPCVVSLQTKHSENPRRCLIWVRLCRLYVLLQLITDSETCIEDRGRDVS